MKILLILLLVAFWLAEKNKTANIYTDEELELNRDFIACHNLGRISTTERYTEITQKETDFAAPDHSGLNRYMIEVTDRCSKLATDEQKKALFEQFKAGERLPKNPDIGQNIVPDINDIFKAAEDFSIPEEQSETNAKVNDPSLKFKNTFDKFKKAKLAEAKGPRKIGIMGMDINDSGIFAKVSYLVIIVLILGVIYFLASKVLNREDNINPKHMPQKSRKDKKKK